jgi:lantibiotic modifying enzyme
MTPRVPWQPVLTGEDAERARSVVDDIRVALVQADLGTEDPGLVEGLSGRALFFAKLAEAQSDREDAARARRLLAAAVKESRSLSHSPGLYAGIIGLAWTAQHLTRLVSSDVLDSLDDIDARLASELAGEPVEGPFELMYGLVGVGVYLLERLPRPDARAALEGLVTWLGARAERSAGGIAWRTSPGELHPEARMEFPNGCYYPGVAHGNAGVIGLLASIAEAGIAVERAIELLEGAVPWLLARELSGGTALFPYQTDLQGIRKPSRSAWCTGGPGISWMLWRAGEVADERSWRERALGLAMDATRRPLAETGVRDACLCHGAAGLGLLYHRWFAATGDERLGDESVRWFRRTLEEQRPGTGVAGFAAMNLPQNRKEAAAGFLFGVAGIGLALLSASAPVTPAWDRLLLQSGPAA